MISTKRKAQKNLTDKAIPTRKKRIITVAAWTAAILFVLNLFTGVISFGIMTVWCLHPPITASRFMADYHYYKPGQPFYGPDAFTQYYCSEGAARRAGFNPIDI